MPGYNTAKQGFDSLLRKYLTETGHIVTNVVSFKSEIINQETCYTVVYINGYGDEKSTVVTASELIGYTYFTSVE